MSKSNYCYPSIEKLNCFQRGILHKILVMAVYVLIASGGALVIDGVFKTQYIDFFDRACDAGKIGKDILAVFRELIIKCDVTIISIVSYLFVLVGILFVILRFLAKFNLAFSVNLEQAVDFKWAMSQLGINTPRESLLFVYNNYIPVFFAISPFLENERMNVSAKLYTFNHTILKVDEIFEKHMGRQTLCLYKPDFEKLMQEHGQKTKMAMSRTIAERDNTIANLQGTICQQTEKIRENDELIRQLKAEIEDMKPLAQTSSARESRLDGREISRGHFWRVAGAMINRLLMMHKQASLTRAHKSSRHSSLSLKTFPISGNKSGKF